MHLLGQRACADHVISSGQIPHAVSRFQRAHTRADAVDLLRTKGLTRLAICLATGRASPPVVGAWRRGREQQHQHFTHGDTLHTALISRSGGFVSISLLFLRNHSRARTRITLLPRAARNYAHGPPRNTSTAWPPARPYRVSRRGRGAGRQAGVREDAARKQERGRGKKTGRRLTLGKLARFGRRRQASVAVWPLRSQVALASHRPPDG